MKLAKSLLLTGILLSSVLGSMNVNSVSVMADETPSGQQPGDTPATSGTQDKPGTSGTQDKPGTSGTQDKPGTSGTQDKPGTSGTQDKPGTSGTQDKPGTSTTQEKPTSPTTPTNPAPTTPTKPTTPSKPIHHASSSHGYIPQTLQITFVNSVNDEQVGYIQINGKAGFSKKIQAPNNFRFNNSNNETIKFDKSGNKSITISVSQINPTVKSRIKVIATMDGQHKCLYDLEGHLIKNRALAKNTSWYSDESATINGETMYRVATNEWVKASDIK